jgi:hypothetical protein
MRTAWSWRTSRGMDACVCRPGTVPESPPRRQSALQARGRGWLRADRRGGVPYLEVRRRPGDGVPMRSRAPHAMKPSSVNGQVDLGQLLGGMEAPLPSPRADQSPPATCVRFASRLLRRSRRPCRVGRPLEDARTTPFKLGLRTSVGLQRASTAAPSDQLPELPGSDT